MPAGALHLLLGVKSSRKFFGAKEHPLTGSLQRRNAQKVSVSHTFKVLIHCYFSKSESILDI
jgi:hypothetical protein